jgi:hypothetical protein
VAYVGWVREQLRWRSAVTLLATALAGCAVLPPPVPPPRLPEGLFGPNTDVPVSATNQAVQTFAVPAGTRGDPVASAKGVIALEYLADELRADPRWVVISPLTKQQMLESRTTVRHVLGIRPEAPPEAVVNALLTVVAALRVGARTAALQALAAPVFTLAPARTLAILSDLPEIPVARTATSQALAEEFGPYGFRPPRD